MRALRWLIVASILSTFLCAGAISLSLTGWLNPKPTTCMWLPNTEPFRTLDGQREVLTCKFYDRYYHWRRGYEQELYNVPPREYEIKGIR